MFLSYQCMFLIMGLIDLVEFKNFISGKPEHAFSPRILLRVSFSNFGRVLQRVDVCLIPPSHALLGVMIPLLKLAEGYAKVFSQ